MAFQSSLWWRVPSNGIRFDWLLRFLRHCACEEGLVFLALPGFTVGTPRIELMQAGLRKDNDILFFLHCNMSFVALCQH
jgi:hypothetical protein